MSGGPTKSSAPETAAMRFLAFVKDSENFATMKSFAESQGWNLANVHQGDVHAAIEHLSTHTAPDFLLVDVANAEEAPDALDKLADVCEPTTKVIVTSTVDEFSFFRWLTEIGVHHYILKPLSDDALKRAFTAHATAAGKAADGTKQGKLVSVIGVRGGVGASTVALNLSAVLSSQHQLSSVLLDLEPQWGTASLMLDLEPGRGLREALAKPDRIDALFLDRVLLKYSDHLALLSSEEPFDEDISIHADAAASLLKETRAKYGMVVADLPRTVDSFTRDIIVASDHVVLVTELSLVCLRDAMRLAEFMKNKLKVKKLHLVANRTGLFGKYEMPASDFEKTLDHKFATQVPFDIELYAKVANGKIPALEKGEPAMAKSMQHLADLVHHQKHATAEGAASGKPKLFKWGFGKGKPA